MKIERINDNQIRCTLTGFDLSIRNVSLNELAYGSEKARKLFREMIQKASMEVGFEAEDIPLMVEAIPMANESVILIITKIEDPEELDARFSKFSQPDEENDTPLVAPASEFLEGADSLKEFLEKELLEKADKPPVIIPEEKQEAAQDQARTFRFQSLDQVIEAAKVTGASFTGENMLYKNPSNGSYYLVLHKTGTDNLTFSCTCNKLSEYGSRIRYDEATEAYYQEHFESIVKKNALQALYII